MDEEKFDIKSTDEEIIATFTSWMRESSTFHDSLKKVQDIVEQYYIGNQTDKDLVPEHNSNTVENRIFEGTETVVPIATANAHHFIVLPASEVETSVKRAKSLQKILERKYETLEIQRKLEEITRDMLLRRFGVAKWCWDEVKDDVDVKVIDPRYIYIPQMDCDPHELPYKIEMQEYSYKEMEDYFPGTSADELSKEKSDNKTDRDIYKVYEVWTPEMVCWINNKKVLEKKANPYFDFAGEEQKYIDLKSKKLKFSKRLVFRNHLDRPADPYVFFDPYKMMTSLAEIGIPIQDVINIQKRRIVDNLNIMGNGQVIMDADAMSEEESNNITNEPGLVIRGEGAASQRKIIREPGVPLPNGHFENLSHSEATFDNIFGVHAATRGAAASKTLGQDIISRQQDYSRVDIITRVLNRGVSRVANGLVQLMKMYYTETQTIKILGEDGTVEFLKLNRNDIEDYIEIVVKDGSVLPMDKVALRTEAVQLWQLGALDPVTLFERLEFPNPDKAAERLMAYKSGQLTQETQARIQENNAATQSKLAADMQLQASAPVPGGGSAGGTAKSKSKAGSKKATKVETPMNVMQRATANLGGTAPTFAGTPNM